MSNRIDATAVISCTTIPAFSWQDWTTCSYTDDLAVFRFNLATLTEICDEPAELESHEIIRAQRFRQADDRHRFVYGRRIIRRLLGAYVGLPPADVTLTIGTNRKPVLAHSADWHFNMSHSGNWILVAVGRELVGVDLEKVVSSFVFQDIIAQSFSQPEQQFIGKSHNPGETFYQLWTRKEALVKATAKGVDEDFARVPSLDGTHRIDSSVIGASNNWLINSFSVDEGYPAAVAYPATVGMPQFYNLDNRFFINTDV
ncbi:4'-phosphopantetheinyl transferase family protein [Spirosoma gilvum]